MDNIPRKVQQVVEDYIRKLARQIPIEKAILFGSYAKGTYDKESDIDIAIFSDYFKNMERLESSRLLFLQAMDYDVDLQPQSFTADELEYPEGLVKEILRTGIEVKNQ